MGFLLEFFPADSASLIVQKDFLLLGLPSVREELTSETSSNKAGDLVIANTDYKCHTDACLLRPVALPGYFRNLGSIAAKRTDVGPLLIEPYVAESQKYNRGII